MPASLPLLNGSITLSAALHKDDDYLLLLSYPKKRLDFYLYLYQRRSTIKAIVAHHLGLPEDDCKVGEVEEWIHGSFNLCVPIYINDSIKFCVRRVIIRFPLPYKLEETQYPGNTEEKLRCEVATYIWIRNNCPAIPIPKLFGYAFSEGQSFMALEHASLLARLQWYFRKATCWVPGSLSPSPYVTCKTGNLLTTGYMIVEYVDEGDMLSKSWEAHRSDPYRRTNLFRDLSRIILLLSRIPLPHIASLTIDDDGVLSLTNRPLSVVLQKLENECIPTGIARNLTYNATDAYYLDLLACHDNVIRYKENAIHDKDDGEAQLSALTMMKALLPHFADRNFRSGPFILTLTDLHQSNIFVDKDWNITKLIDLEWACSLPIEMLHPPHWLTSQCIDTLQDERLDEYINVHKEFMSVFESEERALVQGNTPITHTMWKGWKIGNFWYFSALNWPKGLCNLFFEQIQPMFARCSDKACTDFEEVVTSYWAADAAKLIDSKLKEKESYGEKLRELFANSRESSASGLGSEKAGTTDTATAADPGDGPIDEMKIDSHAISGPAQE
ncbi:hypothetical protein DIZ76_015538 [Coccidioides immitis]|nr:hypothetical protein DIZ76_015538 [Coccidioides immitis]